jgi:Mg2+/citrate symporter
MKDFGNAIYTAACVVAATILGIGVADYWFVDHQFSAFFSWAVLAAVVKCAVSSLVTSQP